MAIKYSKNVGAARDNYLRVLQKVKNEKAAALKSWSDVCIKELKKVSTVSEAIAAFRSAPWGTPAKKEALAKWAEVCTTIEELRAAYDVTYKRFSWIYDNPVLQKWEWMSCIEVHTATTTDELESAYYGCPNVREVDHVENHKPSEVRAFEKWAQFCSTFEELEGLCQAVDRTSSRSYQRDAYDKRYDELYFKKKGVYPVRHQISMM